MPIPYDLAKAAARAGLSIVCATCERYWSVKDRGGSQCGARRPCGSPLVADTFSEYQGVMTEDAFRNFCFACGEEATAHICVPGKTRTIGACAQHVLWAQEPHLEGQPVHVYKPGFVVPPRGTLLGEILHTEKEWAEARGESFSAEEYLKTRA